jgi:Na+/proline symporter
MIFWILTSLAIYLFFLMVIGIRAGRKTRDNPESFFVADRKLNWIQEGLSVYSTAIPGASLLAAVGQFYHSGMAFMGYSFGYGLAGPILYWAIAYRLRRIGAVYKLQTQSDFARLFWGSRTLGWIVSILGITMLVPFLAQLPIAIGWTMNQFTGLPFADGVGLFLVVSLSYALYGGLRAVADTDVYHGILLFLFVPVLIFLIIFEAGGVSALWAAPVNHAVIATNSREGIVIFLPWFIQLAATTSVGPDRALRMFSVKDERNLRLSVMLIAFTVGLTSALYFMEGLALRILASPHTTVPDKAPLLVIDRIGVHYPWLIPCFLVTVWGGSLAVGSVQMLTFANLVVKDIFIPWRSRHKRAVQPQSPAADAASAKASAHETVLVGRIAMVVIGVAASVIAFVPIPNLFAIAAMVMGLWIQMLPLLFLGLFWQRTTTAGILAGIITGIGLSIAWNTILPHPFGTGQPGSIALVVNFLVTAAVSLATRNSADEAAKRARLLTLATGTDEIIDREAPDIRAIPSQADIHGYAD